MQAIVNQTMRTKTDLPTISKVLTGRIAVLAEAQDMVIAGNVGQADVSEIVRRVAQLHGDQLQDRFLVEGPIVTLASRPALALSMILHELGTNATKYGALSSDDGVIRIDWNLKDIDDETALVLRWREEGGPAAVEPVNKGFGTRLIKAGLPSLGASSVEMHFLPEGLVCEITAELASLQTERPD